MKCFHMTKSIVHLIIKTHLDIGFTDYAAEVIKKYFSQFIPQAVTLARKTREHPARFRWTTGAWLIYEYLEQASADERRAMEIAIEDGSILWHALPFTTHTELMDESLFRFALSYSHSLDHRFGKQTIAAKMTDVPGHTRAMIPLLAEAGVRFLHIGVNQASSLPEVPPLFVWRDQTSGSDILVAYHGDYGGLSAVDGLPHRLAVVLTGDNMGPPSETMIAQTYQTLSEQNPGAQIIASTMDDFARELNAVRDRLPVITGEIGDTWIHGVGTDPTKIRRYRELCRLHHDWLAQPLNDEERTRLHTFSRSLIMIPEHTWGMDEKTHLADHKHYEMSDLAQLRQTEACRRFEASWAEQRGYLNTALDALSGSNLMTQAVEKLTNSEPRIPNLADCIQTDDLSLHTGKLHLEIDANTGAIHHLISQQSSFEWSEASHPLALLTYEVFGQADYDRFWEQYIRNEHNPEVIWWAREDFTKPGITTSQHRTWTPAITSVYRSGDTRIICALEFPEEARQYGAPRQLFQDYRVNREKPTQIEITLSWFDKPACRLPEAFWLSFIPDLEQQDAWQFEKLGHWVSPRDVVRRGARGLHAIDQRVRYQDGQRTFELQSLDAPLVAPGKPSLLDFHDRVPDMSGGVHVNLYNNVWGTNFPMWFEDNACFRFSLRMTD